VTSLLVAVLSSSSGSQGDDRLVLPHPETGHPLDRSKLRKRFKAALRAAGLREVRFHDLRHTFGTRMAAVGVPMRTLMEWMGHADIGTTQVYADYAPSEHERGWVEAAFARSTPGTKPTPTERTEAN
jgi:integrase